MKRTIKLTFNCIGGFDTRAEARGATPSSTAGLVVMVGSVSHSSHSGIKPLIVPDSCENNTQNRTRAACAALRLQSERSYKEGTGVGGGSASSNGVHSAGTKFKRQSRRRRIMRRLFLKRRMRLAAPLSRHLLYTSLHTTETWLTAADRLL